MACSGLGYVGGCCGCVGAVRVHEGVGCCWGGAREMHLFRLRFTERIRLGLVGLFFFSFFFFFLILTSQSLPILGLQLLWGKHAS